MDIEKLEAIIRDCLPTEQIDLENVPDGVKVVDVYFFKVGVVMARAEARREELIELLGEWPDISWGHEIPPLKKGPSYIHAGGVVGDQTRAMVLFGIGEALGFWTVITPQTLGFDGDEAKSMAGMGMVMISGYEPRNTEAGATSPGNHLR